jgi:hypothetical protein
MIMNLYTFYNIYQHGFSLIHIENIYKNRPDESQAFSFIKYRNLS